MTFTLSFPMKISNCGPICALARIVLEVLP
jgi:hypothetical protein